MRIIQLSDRFVLDCQVVSQTALFDIFPGHNFRQIFVSLRWCIIANPEQWGLRFLGFVQRSQLEYISDAVVLDL